MYVLGRTQVGEAITCLSAGEYPTKDTMRRAFSCKKPNSGMRVSVGDMGWEEI